MMQSSSRGDSGVDKLTPHAVDDPAVLTFWKLFSEDSNKNINNELRIGFPVMQNSRSGHVYVRGNISIFHDGGLIASKVKMFRTY